MTVFRRYRQSDQRAKVTYTMVKTKLDGSQIKFSGNPLDYNTGSLQGIFDLGPYSHWDRSFKLSPVDIRKGSSQADYVSAVWEGSYAGYKRVAFDGNVGDVPVPAITSGVQPDTPAMEAVMQQAVAKAAEPPVDLALFVGEFDKTAKLLYSPLQQLVRKTGAYQKRYRRELAKHKKTGRRMPGEKPSRKGNLEKRLADLELSYTYGVTPLVYDIQGILQLMEKKVKDRSAQLRVFRASSKSEANTRSAITSSVDAFRFTGEHIINTGTKVSACVFYRIEDLGLPTHGGTMYDVPSYLWERSPYSFIVDWMFKVGQYLRSIQVKPGFFKLGSCVTTTSWETKTRIYNNAYFYFVDPSYRCKSFGASPCITQLKRMQRVLNVLPATTVVANWSFGNIRHTISGASLLIQQAARKAPKPVGGHTYVH